MSGRDWADDDFDFGESTDPEASTAVEPEAEIEVEKAVEADVAVKESEPEGYDPYYDDPVPRGVGGSFVKRDGKRYRRRP